MKNLQVSEAVVTWVASFPLWRKEESPILSMKNVFCQVLSYP